MFKTLWNSFVPTVENDYRPYFLRAWPVAIMLVVIVALWGGAQVAERAITSAGSNLAAVVSAVLVDLANGDRASNDLHALAVNPVLQAAAQMKANDMAAKGYFAHTAPDGTSPWHWFEKAGYKFSYAGENLAVYFTDSADVERAWMNSPGHRANILSPHFTEIGIATAEGIYQGQATTFVVQEFGTPSIEVPQLQSVVLPAAQGGVGTSTPPKKTATSTPPRPKPVKPVATTTPKVKDVATSTPTTTPVTLTIIHEDPQFIAVKNELSVAAPSAYAAALQSTWFERVIASPKTSLAYAYGILAAIIVLALIFLIVFEMKTQRPMNIIFAVLLILLILILLYVSESRVVVEGVALLVP